MINSEQVDVLNPELKEGIKEIQLLDPELLEYSDETKRLVEIGIKSINLVTEKFGSPKNPKWASGSYEQNVIMSYHNAGADGHSGIGCHGAGVPRNVLVVANAINEAAGSEVYDPLSRAIAFNAAAAHDIIQLCGRSLLPEGQVDASRGDERLSAEYARDVYIQSGGNIDIAQKIYDGVMATSFDPNTGSQNVYGREHYSNEGDYLSGSLGQELVAAADLFGPTTLRGSLGALEYCIEWLSTFQKENITQARLASVGKSPSSISSIEEMVDFIDSDKVLRQALSDTLTGQSKFFKDFITYSDKTIRLVSGKGIDELFPGRLNNGDILQGFSDDMKAGKTAMEIYEDAQRISRQGTSF
jgi:hypothetical protein